MPLGYQITQKDHPIALEGYMDFFVYSDNSSKDQHIWKYEFPTYSRRLKIQRLQLEMDSGKLLKLFGTHYNDDIHLKKINENDVELIDLNRAGTSLVEIVTEPELYSAYEAICFVEQLRCFLQHNRICTGDMHKGHLRVDANVSMVVDGKIGQKVEVKNLNSFRFLRNAITFEIQRQRRLIQSGKSVEEETRCLDEHHVKTIPMREKGEMLDYRFTPEVNLPRLSLETEKYRTFMKSVSFEAPHLEFIKTHGFPPAYVFQTILKDQELEQFIRHLMDGLAAEKLSLCFDTMFVLMAEFQRICEQCGHRFPPKKTLLLQTLCDAIVLEHEGRLTRALCLDLLKLYASGSESRVTLRNLIQSENLWRIRDQWKIDEVVEKVLLDNNTLYLTAQQVVSLVGGKPAKRNKHLNRLRDEVVRRSGKRIAVEDAESRLIQSLLNSV